MGDGRRVVILGPGPYGGMDRPPLGAHADLPQETVARGLACEAAQDVAGIRRFLTGLARGGVGHYEPLALGGRGGGSAWDFLGLDVGEPGPARWSAVRRRAEVLDPGTAGEWDGRLNAHGLLTDRADADAFLDACVQARPASRAATGGAPAADRFAVVPVQRLRRSATRPDAVLWYTVGNEHAPGDPFGRIVLVLCADCTAELEHHARTGSAVWHGEVRTGVLEQVRRSPETGGFPEVPRHPVPACAAMRQIEMTIDGDPRYPITPDCLGSEPDGYKAAFAMLDSLTVQLGSGAYAGAADTLGPSVSNVRKVA